MKLLRGTPKEYLDAMGTSPTWVIVMQPGDKTAL